MLMERRIRSARRTGANGYRSENKSTKGKSYRDVLRELHALLEAGVTEGDLRQFIGKESEFFGKPEEYMEQLFRNGVAIIVPTSGDIQHPSYRIYHYSTAAR